MLDAGGKEVSEACSFLLASLNPVPRGVQGLAGAIVRVTEQDQQAPELMAAVHAQHLQGLILEAW